MKKFSISLCLIKKNKKNKERNIIRFRWNEWETTWEPPEWRHPKNTSKILPIQLATVHSISIPCKESWKFDCSINILYLTMMVCKLLLYEQPYRPMLDKTDRISSKSRENCNKRKRFERKELLVAFDSCPPKKSSKSSIRITLNEKKKWRTYLERNAQLWMINLLGCFYCLKAQTIFFFF